MMTFSTRFCNRLIQNPSFLNSSKVYLSHLNAPKFISTSTKLAKNKSSTPEPEEMRKYSAHCLDLNKTNPNFLKQLLVEDELTLKLNQAQDTLQLTVFFGLDGLVLLRHQLLDQHCGFTSAKFNASLLALTEAPKFANGAFGYLIMDNAMQHSSAGPILKQLGLERLPHPAYAQELQPCDSHLFPAFKKHLRATVCSPDTMAPEALTALFNDFTRSKGTKKMMAKSIQELPNRWEKRLVDAEKVVASK